MPALHPYIKKRRQEDKKFEEIILPALEKLSKQFYEIKREFEEWQESDFSTRIVDSTDIPFKKWIRGKEWIGVGLSGNDAYDYSGRVVGILPNEREMVLSALLDDIYTGETKASFLSHAGLFYLTYFESLMKAFDSGELAEYCPFPYYLDAEDIEENEEAFEWELEQQCLISDFLQDVTFRDVVEI